MASTVFPFSFQHICQVLNPWCQHKGSSSNTHHCCCSQTPPVLVALPQIRCAVAVEWVWALNSLSLWPWWPWILFPLTNSFFKATVTPAHRLGFQWNWLWSLQKLSQKTMITVWGMHLHQLCFFSCYFAWLSCLVLIQLLSSFSRAWKLAQSRNQFSISASISDQCSKIIHPFKEQIFNLMLKHHKVCFLQCIVKVLQANKCNVFGGRAWNLAFSAGTQQLL